MVFNELNNKKVPIFLGINDEPREPTITTAGNGSDLINRFNTLIDELTNNFLKKRITTDTHFFVNAEIGDDNSTGLNLEEPFRTIQKAVNVASELEIIDCKVVINLQPTTSNYEPVTLKSFSGNGKIIIKGDIAQEFIEQYKIIAGLFNFGSNHNAAIYVKDVQGLYELIGLTIEGDNGSLFPSSCGIFCENSHLRYSVIQFNEIDRNHHVFIGKKGYIEVFPTEGGYMEERIYGNADCHWFVEGGILNLQEGSSTEFNPSFSVTFSNALAYCSLLGIIELVNTGFDYQANCLGTRFKIFENSIIRTSINDLEYIPGNASGITETGGQYSVRTFG